MPGERSPGRADGMRHAAAISDGWVCGLPKSYDRRRERHYPDRDFRSELLDALCRSDGRLGSPPRATRPVMGRPRHLLWHLCAGGGGSPTAVATRAYERLKLS
jgi:hypothetical protein